MLCEPSEATKVAKKTANAIEALGDVVRNASNDTYQVKCVVPEDLAMAMGMYAAYHMAPGRCPLGPTWTGPGFYEIWNDIGASQAQDWTKLDDSVVMARKVAELP